jgi:excisionase family DNA binding protein
MNAVVGSDEKWYSVKEFAALFAVSRDTVARWIQKGVLRAFRFPASSSRRPRKYVSYRISESERQRFIRQWMTS